MIAHLRGREQALEPFGWTGRQAEWIALACLHSGVFIRAQWSRFLDAHPEQVRRGVHSLIAQGAATEETVPGIKGIGRVCRIFSRRIYRALGAEDIRHRRSASEAVLMRRLLSLDYVLEHPDLPWLPTESEKIGAFEALGIERRILPSRLYRGAAGNTRRYFPLKLPVALEAERALFVYVEPGHDTSTALRSWGEAHRGLWQALSERGRVRRGSWRSSALSRSSLGPGRYSAAGQKPPARPNRTPGSVKRSTVSSGPSFKARSRSSTSSEACRPR